MAINYTGWISLLILGLLRSASAEVGDKVNIIMSKAFDPHPRNVSTPVSTTQFLLQYSPPINVNVLVQDMNLCFM